MTCRPIATATSTVSSSTVRRTHRPPLLVRLLQRLLVLLLTGQIPHDLAAQIGGAP